ncbi:MAG: hypothetical protein DRJ45_06740 [Thermoprotei archaeon]|mgnify:CR=1 FL=1|nr:MAG: hypothetical protein DRJ45_06740 [Thermoprotei archaeon]
MSKKYPLRKDIVKPLPESYEYIYNRFMETGNVYVVSRRINDIRNRLKLSIEIFPKLDLNEIKFLDKTLRKNIDVLRRFWEK